MLKTTLEFNRNETVTLIPNSGVQFLDFAFDIADVARLSRLVTYDAVSAEARSADSTRQELLIYPVEQTGDGTRLYRPRGSAGPV